MKASKVLTRIVIAVLSFVMAFGMLSLVACSDGNDGTQNAGGGVEITLSDASIDVQVGKSKRLTGTVNVDGAKLTWSSADESIATVSATGQVKGVKVGKTTVTATYESHTATCEVNVIDSVTVTLSEKTLAMTVGGETKTLTATASNGGTIEWSSSDATVAKVENGVVTALKEGTATIYAECAGSRDACEVTVTDPNRTAITAKAADSIGDKDLNKMFYFAVDGARAIEDEMYYSVADDTYHVKFENSGWAWYGFQLFYKKSGIVGANNNVSFKLNSSKAGHITVNGTPFALIAGDNSISLDGFTGMLSIQFGLHNGQQANDLTGEISVTITELAFTPYTPEKLAAPTGFTVTEKTIAITDDANGDKVQSYRVVFYKDEVKKGEVTVEKNGTIEDGAIEDGEYTLAVYAYSTGRYTSSDECKPDPAVTYTVANGGIKYDATFSGEEGIEAGKWYYWKEAGTVSAKVEKGKLRVEFSENGGNWYNVQLFYLDPLVDKTKTNKITFTLNSSAAGHIHVNGNVIEITEANVGKDVEYTIYNIGSGKATVSIQMGNGSSIDIVNAIMVFTFTNPIATEYEKVKLATPSVTFGEEYAYTIADETNDAANVDGYNLVFYKDGKAVTTVKTKTKMGKLDVTAIASGSYTVKVVAAGSGLYANSDESDGVSLEIVNEGGVKYNIANNGEGDACKAENKDKWWFWNDQNWCGSNVTIVGTPAYNDGTVTIGYTSTGTCDFGLQLFYKSSTFNTGDSHKLTMKVTAEKDATIKVNGKTVELKAGVETVIEVTTDEEDAKASISIQFDISAEHNANTFTLSDIVLEPAGGEEPAPETPETPAE